MRTALRRLACVAAVGIAALAGVAEVRAGAVSISPEHFKSPGADRPVLSVFQPPVREMDNELIARPANSGAPGRADPLARLPAAGSLFDSSPINAAPMISQPPNSATIFSQRRSEEPADPVVNTASKVTEPGASDGIPPAAMIPLPAGLWTGIAGLGGLLALGRGRAKLI